MSKPTVEQMARYIVENVQCESFHKVCYPKDNDECVECVISACSHNSIAAKYEEMKGAKDE